jgi:putative ABC transport system permease protein
MPPSLHDRLFGEFDFNIEMFVLSGVMVVIASSLVIVYNAALIARVVTSRSGRRYRTAALFLVATVVAAAAGLLAGSKGNGLGQLAYMLGIFAGLGALLAASAVRFPRLAPAFKMAVAYPLANRFRTGMTLAMFSLIVFSLTVFSILVENFSALQGGESARGGLDLTIQTNGDTPLADLSTELAGTAGVESVGSTTVAGSHSEANQPGEDEGWGHIPVLTADAGYFADIQPGLEAHAHGFATDAEVYAALLANPSYALIDNQTLGGDNNEYDFAAHATIEDDEFDPFQVQIRDGLTGQTATVTVIGKLESRLPASHVQGIYVSNAVYTAVFGEPAFSHVFAGLADGADATAIAEGIESSFAIQGVRAEATQDILDRQQAADAVFNRMFQAFMALGLVVGIAGLGVIAMRSVVERRQQIGMLRAIGYQRGLIAVTFLFESAFIAAAGILAGIAGGTVVGRNLMTSDTVTGGGEMAPFGVPWLEVAVMAVLALIASLAMTWLPSRGAARVPVAEALRYE